MSILKAHLHDEQNYELFYTDTQAGAAELIKDHVFTAALVDLHLPDSPNGEVVDITIDANIPTIVMTSSESKALKELIWNKKLVDYVIKEGAHSLDYISQILEQLINNKTTKILIVDDSEKIRTQLEELLSIQQLQIFLAESGEKALEILNCNPDIKLVLADYHMEGINGIELTRKIRKHFSLNKLAIIGISSSENQEIAVSFIKNGANDFLGKPFSPGMLYCRINNNLKLLDLFSKIQDSALIDPLTKVPNRRHLFTAAEALMNNAFRDNKPLFLAMIDLDYFKSINDTYGHLAGDYILKSVAKIFKDSIRVSDLLCRFGGEEFCIVFTNIADIHNVVKKLEAIRISIHRKVFEFEGNEIQISISCGICPKIQKSFNEMIRIADTNLYKAKEEGRNCIRFG